MTVVNKFTNEQDIIPAQLFNSHFLLILYVAKVANAINREKEMVKRKKPGIAFESIFQACYKNSEF